MHRKFVIGTFASAALITATPLPAKSLWESQPAASAAMQWELGYLALSAIDAGQTIECLHRDACEESNPLFGKHPTAGKLLAAKIALGAAHFVLFKRVYDKDSRMALRLAQMSVLTQGGVVALNARFAFH
jgi:hypothetical protein